MYPQYIKMENRMQQKSDERRSQGGERRFTGGKWRLMLLRPGLLSGRLPGGNPELRLARLVYPHAAYDLSSVLKYPGKIEARRQWVIVYRKSGRPVCPGEHRPRRPPDRQSGDTPRGAGQARSEIRGSESPPGAAVAGNLRYHPGHALTGACSR